MPFNKLFQKVEKTTNKSLLQLLSPTSQTYGPTPTSTANTIVTNTMKTQKSNGGGNWGSAPAETIKKPTLLGG